MNPPSSRRSLSCCSWLAVLCACGGGGSGGSAPTLRFDLPQQFTTDLANASALAVVDLDHNGIADLLVADSGRNRVAVMHGVAGGTFGPATPIVVAAIAGAVAGGNIDADRLPDLVTASSVGGAVTVYPNRGAGAFDTGTTYAVGAAAGDLVVHDFTGDGRADVVTSSRAASSLGVLLADQSGGFIANDLDLPVVPGDLVVADFDGDGVPDLATAGPGSSTILTIKLGGTAGFQILQSAAPVLTGRACAGDFDGDGKADLAVLADSGARLVTMLGTGTGLFHGGVAQIMPSAILGLAAGDLDLDGKLDLVLTTANQVWAVYGDGRGGFSAPQVLYVDPSSVSSPHLQDLEGKGHLDIVFLSAQSHVSVLRNPKPAPAGLATFGTGTPDCNGALGLLALSQPSVGNAAFTYACTNAPAGRSGLLLQGGPQIPAGADLLGIGCLLHLGPDLIVVRTVTSDAAGRAALAEPIPADASLAGLVIAAQMLWQVPPGSTCSASADGFISSRGLLVTIQAAAGQP
ncbi:MAG TPA: VCBS repeat-containing protein [Planctomycetota bacterium]|nr:VCBS repeat-containing protein [Planctomycetota bacterium]